MSNKTSQRKMYCLTAALLLVFFPSAGMHVGASDLDWTRGGGTVSSSSSAGFKPLSGNGKIAFTSGRDNNQEIYVMNSDGSQQARLTNTAAAEMVPTWSPDGTKIAFISNGFYLKVMNADGSDQTTLTLGDLDSTLFQLRPSLSWSPDGRRIAFASAGEIFTIGVDGSNLINLTNNSANDGEPDWSPDGSKIAFVSNRTHPLLYSVYTMNANGGNVQLDLPPSGDHTSSPKWSPDGQQLAFIEFNFYDPYAGVLKSRDLLGHIVAHTGCCAVSGFDWSPDGTRFVLQYYLFPQYQVGIYSLGARDGSLVPLVLGFAASPNWQPLIATPPFNQIDAAGFFVRQHYRDFLNREPDAEGLAYWTGEITSCGGDAACVDNKRTNVSAAYFLSIEFQETGYLVYRTYKAAYGNLPNTPVPLKFNDFLPDTQQIGQGVIVNQFGWEQLLESNKQNFFFEFVQRSRFTSLYPTSLTPGQFVNQLLTNTGVAFSTSDRDTAINEFGGMTNTADIGARARALRRVAENQTLAQQEFNRAFVLMQYFGYLRRNPNDAPEATLNFDGYNFWLNKLNQFNGDYIAAEMVKAFLLSTEYRQRFGP